MCQLTARMQELAVAMPHLDATRSEDLTDSVRQPAALSPSPRHLRRRRFRREVPSSLLVAGSPTQTLAEDSLPRGALPPNDAGNLRAGVDVLTTSAPTNKVRSRKPRLGGEAKLRRKRLVALAIVILVSLSIPLLAFTLIFAR